MRTYYTRTTAFGTSIWYEENGYRISFTDKDPANTDYQTYLAWVAEGNTAEEWNPDADSAKYAALQIQMDEAQNVDELKELLP